MKHYIFYFSILFFYSTHNATANPYEHPLIQNIAYLKEQFQRHDHAHNEELDPILEMFPLETEEATQETHKPHELYNSIDALLEHLLHHINTLEYLKKIQKEPLFTIMKDLQKEILNTTTSPHSEIKSTREFQEISCNIIDNKGLKDFKNKFFILSIKMLLELGENSIKPHNTSLSDQHFFHFQAVIYTIMDVAILLQGLEFANLLIVFTTTAPKNASHKTNLTLQKIVENIIPSLNKNLEDESRSLQAQQESREYTKRQKFLMRSKNIIEIHATQILRQILQFY